MRPLDQPAAVSPLAPALSTGPDPITTAASVQRQIRIRSSGRVAVVTTPAAVGSENAQEFWEALAVACGSHAVTIADMTGTLVCGHDAVTALLMALRRADAGGGELWLAVSAPVGGLISKTAISGAFPTFHSLADALASLPVRPPDLI